VLQDDRFVFINPRYTDITGYKLEEISGEDFDFRIMLSENGLKVLNERSEKQNEEKRYRTGTSLNHCVKMDKKESGSECHHD